MGAVGAVGALGALRLAKPLAAALAALTIAASAHAQQARTGIFEGRGGHEASGGVTVERAGERWVMRFAEDFRLDRAPDPRIAFGNDGYDASTTLGRLKSLKGAARYRLPGRIDPAGYNEVWLWCKKFDVPLAVAKLK